MIDFTKLLDKEKRMEESRKMLTKIIGEAGNVYRDRENVYSDNWRNASIEEIFDKLQEEFKEIADNIFGQNATDKKLKAKCLDIINVAAMLAAKVDSDLK